MTLFRPFSAAAVLALSTYPAFADLTAEQVLDDFIRQIEAGGLVATVDGRNRLADRLTISGVTFSGEIEGGQMSVTMGGAEFIEQGDGTVRIAYPETLPISVSFTDGEESFAGTATLVQSGLSYVASGSPERFRYDYAADTLSVSDITITEPAEAAEFPFDFSLDMSGMSGVTELGAGMVRDYDATFAIAEMAMTMGFADPAGEEGEFAFQFSLADLGGSMNGAAAPVALNASAADTINAGNRAAGRISHGQMNYTLNVDSPDGPFNMSAAIGSGDFDFDFGREGLSYSTTGTDTSFTLFGGAIPLPLSISIAESSGTFQMPLLPSEQEQEFALAFTLGGFEIDEMIWGMFDPTGQLPRDPATISLDLAGKVVVTEDFTASDYGMDPEAISEMPGTIESLKLNGLEVSLAGASLTGNGAFNFNNEMGIPLPAGIANFRLTGANALMDTLVGMGLLPEEQAMGARMMLSMFARPDGEDDLTSTIEVKEDGSILANGQRIK